MKLTWEQAKRLKRGDIVSYKNLVTHNVTTVTVMHCTDGELSLEVERGAYAVLYEQDVRRGAVHSSAAAKDTLTVRSSKQQNTLF